MSHQVFQRGAFGYKAVLITCAVCASLFLAASFFWSAAVSATPTIPVQVGLVLSPGGLDDPFNWLSHQGLLRAESELGVTGTVYTSTLEEDVYPNLAQCAEDGNQICFGVAWLAVSPIQTVAETYTSTLFALLDGDPITYTANLRGIAFDVGQAAYLAGELAGLMTESDVIGDIGGMTIPEVTAFTEAYEKGALCANPSVTNILTYTNSFGDPDQGALVAQELIADGADVIFAAAGGTGSGAILTATQSSAWGIGVDIDQYYSLFGGGTVDGADKMLSSVIKQLDNALFLTVQDVISATFTSGVVTYGYAQEGVSLAPFHETEPFVPAAVKAYLDWHKRGLTEGWISVDGVCLSTKVFIPLLSRATAP